MKRSDDDVDLPAPAGARPAMQGEDEDRELIAACQRGEGASHFALYSKYSGKVYGLARRFLGDEQHAEDVTQEVFLRVFRKLAAFRGDARFSTWLFRITVNSCKNKRRSLDRHGRFDSDRFLVDRREEEDAPEDVLTDRALGVHIDQALAALGEEQRAVLLLKAHGELSYREIGDMFGQSESQVRGRLYRARKAFRSALAALGEAAAWREEVAQEA
ncbi:MAG: sigma-70 family RNA polymerase sigma factor [Planctomycetes bacterium]|nr:sigma-70 family RNA polymerase sigma factor [Planctomycetota bacterium]